MENKVEYVEEDKSLTHKTTKCVMCKVETTYLPSKICDTCVTALTGIDIKKGKDYNEQ